MHVVKLVVLKKPPYDEVTRHQSLYSNISNRERNKRRLLRQASLCVSMVVSSSNVSLTLPTTLHKWDLTLFTAVSHSQPTKVWGMYRNESPLYILDRTRHGDFTLSWLRFEKFDELFDFTSGTNKICAMIAPQSVGSLPPFGK